MKKASAPKRFDYFLHPYLFVLKEGNEIKKDYLDYSLLMFQVGHVPVLPGPSQPIKLFSTSPIRMLKK